MGDIRKETVDFMFKKCTNIYMGGCEKDGYTLFYTNLNGNKTSHPLGTNDYALAKARSAVLMEVTEAEIKDG